jgi:ketosteroid isomerase-like protein
MDDAYAIAVAKTVYRDGYNEGNVDKILSVFAPGFFDMSEGQPYFGGSTAVEALRTRLHELFRNRKVRLEPLIIDVVVNGGEAYDLGWHRVWIQCEGAQEREGRLRYFERWKKQPDGTWKIIFLMTAKDEAPAMEPLSEIAAWERVCGVSARS